MERPHRVEVDPAVVEGQPDEVAVDGDDEELTPGLVVGLPALDQDQVGEEQQGCGAEALDRDQQVVPVAEDAPRVGADDGVEVAEREEEAEERQAVERLGQAPEAGVPGDGLLATADGRRLGGVSGHGENLRFECFGGGRFLASFLHHKVTNNVRDILRALFATLDSLNSQSVC